jgi:hypothetical protein
MPTMTKKAMLLVVDMRLREEGEGQEEEGKEEDEEEGAQAGWRRGGEGARHGVESVWCAGGENVV